jgi:hypothetical protein
LCLVNKDNQTERATAFWVFYPTIDVSVIEETLLFDFTAIVAAVGGSLGLFIGFSFLDVLRAAIDKFIR